MEKLVQSETLVDFGRKDSFLFDELLESAPVGDRMRQR
jgi:hypothetical protein